MQGSCPGYGKMKDLWHNGAPGNITGEYAEDIFKREALRVINEHPLIDSEPMYLNYNLHIPHLPAQITDEYMAKCVRSLKHIVLVHVLM